jgi:hypothetical protein
MKPEPFLCAAFSEQPDQAAQDARQAKHNDLQYSNSFQAFNSTVSARRRLR